MPNRSSYDMPGRKAGTTKVVLRWSAIALLTLFIGYLGLVYVLSSGSYMAPKKMATLYYLKGVVRAIEPYLADNDLRFPLDTSSVKASLPALKNYLKDAQPPVSYNPNSPEFLGDGSLAGLKSSLIKDPSGRLIYFDSAPWPAKFRVAAFVDGHVASVKEPEFQAAVVNGWVVVRSP